MIYQSVKSFTEKNWALGKQPFLELILNLFTGMELMISEVPFHLWEQMEVMVQDQDCMVDEEEFPSPRGSRDSQLWQH